MNNMKEKYQNDIIILNKIKHIENTEKIAKEIMPENKLLSLGMAYHDIGRFKQYEIISFFDDNIISHRELGEQTIAKELMLGNLKNSYELDVIRSIIQYHGTESIIPFKNQIDKEVIKLVEIATEIDGLENGCIGVTRYLEREILNDEKNFAKRYKNLDMKSVSEEIWKIYKAGEKIPKIMCKTYADYLLFASSLAINGKNKKLAIKLLNEQNNEYGTTIEWYEYMFRKYLTKEYIEEAVSIFKSQI